MGTQFHHDTQMQQGKVDDISEYEPSVRVPDNDLKLLDSMMTLRNVDGGKACVRAYVKGCLILMISV